MSGEVKFACALKVGSKKNNKLMNVIELLAILFFSNRGMANAISTKNGNIAQWLTAKLFPKIFQHKAMYIPKIGGCPLSKEFGNQKLSKLLL
jgi:hypothetical protein